MIYRLATQAEEPAILALLGNVFGVERGADRWHWQYRNSPSGPGMIGIAALEERIVGCLALMRQDLNVTGTRIAAAQACDGMLDSEFRGSGHFAAVGRTDEEAARAAGVQLILGFPNQNSFPTMLAHLGHRRVLVLKQYYRRLGARKLLGPADLAWRPVVASGEYVRLNVLRLRRGEILRMETSREVPRDTERFLARARRYEVLSVWKDAAYLQWRYAQHPENEYEFVTLWRGEEMQALAVTRNLGASVAICELMQQDRDSRLAAVLAHRLALRAARDPRCQLIEFYGSDISFYDAAFAEARWSSSPHSRLTMTAKALAGGALDDMAAIPTNWLVTYGDTDVI